MNDRPKILHVTVDAGTAQTRRKSGSTKNQQHQTISTNSGTKRPTLPIDTLSRLLSQRNITLLKMIKTAQPASVAELARLSGRPKASLTLTLRRLEQFGIVVFKTNGGRAKIPTVACDRLMLEVPITP